MKQGNMSDKEEGANEFDPFAEVDVLGSGNLIKKTITQGDESKERASTGMEVNINVLSVKVDDKHVEYSIDGTNDVSNGGYVTFIVGDNDVCHAWELVVPLLHPGEKCRIRSRRQFDGSVKMEEDSWIEYVVEVEHVKSRKPIHKLELKERIAQGNQKRARGNFLFKQEQWDLAATSFHRGIKYATSTEGSSEMEVLCGTLWNNLAQVQLKCSKWNDALESCENTIRLDKKNIKAYYRKAKALQAKKEYELAIECVQTACNFENDNKTPLKKLLAVLKNQQRQSSQEKTELYKRMAAGIQSKSSSQPKDTKSLSSLLGLIQNPYSWVLALIASCILIVSILSSAISKREEL
eukprot:m.95787 g.95787  ORF g.95787 m.95787 type:complete len:351 (+) comp13516_c0_seq1:66-1118(+)